MKARGRRALAYAGLFFALDCLAAGTWLAACGDEPLNPNPVGAKDGGADAADAGDASDGFDGNTCVIFDASTLDAAQVANGLAIIKTHKCFDCHGDTLTGNFDGVQDAFDEGGVAYPPNLTQDPVTGLGCWTTDQIVGAILNGVDNMGNYLCPPMPVFSEAGALTLDQDQAEAVAAYVQSLAPIVSNVPNTNCPPPGTMPPPGDGGGDGSADAASGDSGNGGAGGADAGNGDAGNGDAGSGGAGGADAGNGDAGSGDGGGTGGGGTGGADAGPADGGDAGDAAGE
jgi:hypothetical protein